MKAATRFVAAWSIAAVLTPATVDAQTTVPDARQISGIYPHLTTYGVYSQEGGHFLEGHNECGIGAVVPWAGKLWMVNYAPHMPRGSEHKLFSIDRELQMMIHPESVGGTPAGRMIHRESQQLLMAHYAIDQQGKVRVIDPEVMPIRVTAIARHLTDPANRVYYVDMEGSLYEADVATLEVKRLFEKPVPGWHGKGGFTAQGRLIVTNNGEHAAGSYRSLVVGGPAQDDEEAGVLAEWDGDQWRIVERRQYTDVTGPGGIHGGNRADEAAWAIGWDRRSLRLKLLDDGAWHTYLLPKAAHCNDARHGWYTEWPRIREITDGRWMMDMHGMFFDFPKTFSRQNTSGLRPIGSHLRYVPDFCDWNGQLVLATDETSIQGNPLAGQPQSNLWFGSYDDLKTWGPASGYGGPWIQDDVVANEPSEPFLIAGFDHRTLHLAVGRNETASVPQRSRTTDQLAIDSLPSMLASMPLLTVPRGDWHQPAPGFSLTVDRPVTVFLAVDERGSPQLDREWSRTNLVVQWGGRYRDTVYRRSFPAGKIVIPGNATEHTPGAFGMPHAAFVTSDADQLTIQPSEGAALTDRPVAKPDADDVGTAVIFRLQVDVAGRGEWTDHESVEVPHRGYTTYQLPRDLNAVWLRLVPSRDCVATAYLHQTADHDSRSGVSAGSGLFAGLAEAGENTAIAGRVYAAKRTRNLRVIASDNRHFDFTKAGFGFEAQDRDQDLEDLLEVQPEFSVDDSSVVLEHGGERLRLPKGGRVFDAPFASGWPRGSREVESERHLANFHGTFYEVPLITNGQPPAFELMRPVASHGKHITDFCSWNGLLVLAGVGADAEPGEHVYLDHDARVGLWFGGVDDLWKLGKPVGHGGPWLRTPTKAGEASDPYLMTGYDEKRLTLWSDVDTTITAEVDFDHQSGWHRYRAFELQAGQSQTFTFPPGFSAHWIRFTAADDCLVTAQLAYE